MKVLVTGASGFLGGHIAQECAAAGDEVRVLVRPGSETGHLSGLEQVNGDLADSGSLERAVKGVDAVHHSAARVLDHGSRRDFHETNVTGTRNLLEAARDAGAARFVFVSSPSAVMTGRDQLDADESEPYPRRYLNLYSETKAAAERLVLAADEPGFTTCAIRPRGVWGPRDWHGFMPKLLKLMLAGRMPDLSGGRTVLASLCHCANAARACRLAALSGAAGGKAYFVTDAETTDVWALMAEVAARFGAEPPAPRIPAPVTAALVTAVEAVWKIPRLARNHPPPLSRYSAALLTRSTTYDISAARRDLGYEPMVSRRDGLEALWAWVEEIGGPDAFTGRV